MRKEKKNESRTEWRWRWRVEWRKKWKKKTKGEKRIATMKGKRRYDSIKELLSLERSPSSLLFLSPPVSTPSFPRHTLLPVLESNDSQFSLLLVSSSYSFLPFLSFSYRNKKKD